MNPSTTLGKALAEHRERLGEPVTSEELMQLHDAALASESLSEEERIQRLDRVAADPEAARKLRVLMRFPEASAEEEAEGVDERWLAFKARLSSPDARPEEDRQEKRRSRSPTLGRKQSFGLLAASLSALSLWLGWTLRGPGLVIEPNITDIQVNIPIVEMTTSETHRGPQRIFLSADAEAFVVVLSAPEILTRRPLDLILLDAENEVVVRRAGILPDEGSLYSAVLSRELLGPGVYDLQLHNEGREVLASFPIEVFLDR